MIVDKDLYILFLENRLKEVKLLHTNEIEENRELKAEINDLKVELELLQGGDEQGIKCSNQLQVDRLNADNDKLLEYNNRLLADIKELKAELDKAENFRQCMYNDMDREVKAEKVLNTANRQTITKLKAENDDLKVENKTILDNGLHLLSEIKGLKENNNKHYPKEYKQDAEEYFDHNPQCSKLFFFMIEGNEFDEDGDYNGSLYADDCIAEIDNL